MKPIVLIIGFLVFGGPFGLAQSGFEYTVKQHKKHANAFELPSKCSYALSTQKYKEKYGDMPGDGLRMLQLGDNYRLNGMPVEAALWYSRGIDYARSPEDHFHLAQSLKMVGQCEEANKRYHIYLKLKGMPAVDLCTNVESGDVEIKVTFEHLPYVNSPASDFAAAPWGDRLLFTSDRIFTRPGAIQDTWTLRNYASMFYSERDKSGQWRSVKRLRSIDSRYHDGVASFDPGGSLLFFTRSYGDLTNSQGVRDLSIHRALWKGNGWDEHGALPFNNPKYATAHPTLTGDGKVMVFASDMPGGYGGMDLYKVERKGDTWGLPENLGPEINSSGNELFPTISSDGYLFYASDGLIGFGGLDVFVAPPEEDYTWMNSYNLGHHVNSSYDDFALVPLPGRRTGYISTNRPGGLGLDDIYSWTSDLPLGERKVSKGEVLVLDAETGLPVPNARIRFGKNVLTTNQAGRVTLKSPVTGPQSIQAEADGFMPSIQGVDLPSKDIQTIKLSPAVYQPYLFDARDIATKANLPNATFEVFEFMPSGQMVALNKEVAFRNYDQFAKEQRASNAPGEDPAEATKPEKGSDSNKETPWILDARKRYQIKAKDQGYLSTFIDLTAPEITGNGPLTRKTLDLEPVILGIEEDDLTEGASFRLDGIYYDYNKANIRLDARSNLDELARLMAKYPKMMIELSSHTDSRGNDLYNLDLSQRRADAAIDYLHGLGIATDRMVARGYGERQPVNHCKDGVNCSEEDHQLNRRTQFRIIRM